MEKLEKGAVFMICGSVTMQHGVLEVLENLTETILERPMSDFEHNEQLKMDCY